VVAYLVTLLRGWEIPGWGHQVAKDTIVGMASMPSRRQASVRPWPLIKR
jgi:hypothetical protein